MATINVSCPWCDETVTIEEWEDDEVTCTHCGKQSLVMYDEVFDPILGEEFQLWTLEKKGKEASSMKIGALVEQAKKELLEEAIAEKKDLLKERIREIRMAEKTLGRLKQQYQKLLGEEVEE